MMAGRVTGAIDRDVYNTLGHGKWGKIKQCSKCHSLMLADERMCSDCGSSKLKIVGAKLGRGTFQPNNSLSRLLGLSVIDGRASGEVLVAPVGKQGIKTELAKSAGNFSLEVMDSRM